MFEQKINNLIGKRMPRAIGGQKGYTLVEIIMVIVILGVIGAFTFHFVANGVQAFKKSSARKDLYDQGRLALERMVRELRDGKEVTDCSTDSITFKVAHPAAFGVVDEIKYQLNGTDLERVGDPSGTPLTAVLASNVTSLSLGGEGATVVGFTPASTGSATAGATGITISHTVAGSNRLMLVGVSINNDNFETVTGVTWNGTENLTLVGSEAGTNDGEDGRVEIWSLVAPSTGTHDVVITFSAALAQEAAAGVMTFTGVDQTTPLGTFASNAGDDSTPATVNIPSASGELVFGVVASEYDTLTASSGQTEQWNLAVPSTYGAGGTDVGAPTVTMSWNLSSSSNHWAIGGVSIKPAAPTVDSCSTGVISFDAASSGSTTASNSLTFGHTIGTGSNRILAVTVSIENCNPYPTVTGITYNGQALTKADSAEVISAGGCGGRAELWYLLEANLPGTGPYNVVVTLSGTADQLIAGAISLIGVDQGAPEATATNTNESTDYISANIITVTDGSWLVDSVHSGNDGSYTPDAGQTERYDLNAAGTTSRHAASTKEVATAGATTTGQTLAGANRQAYVVAAFAPAASTFPLVNLQLTLSSAEGGSVSMRTKVYMRNIP
jgi:prepilin-type N-terminal cleavage/methylation domain-containing protein